MLSIQNLSFSYGMVSALHKVSMTMQPGNVTCVMGRNGVGKTTLMKNIIGLLRPNTGSITLAGKNVTAMPANHQGGHRTFPQAADFPKLSVEENLQVGLEARSDGRRTIPEELFELFPVLKTMARRMGGDLSGGQQQQLAIAERWPETRASCFSTSPPRGSSQISSSRSASCSVSLSRNAE